MIPSLTYIVSTSPILPITLSLFLTSCARLAPYLRRYHSIHLCSADSLLILRLRCTCTLLVLAESTLNLCLLPNFMAVYTLLTLYLHAADIGSGNYNENIGTNRFHHGKVTKIRTNCRIVFTMPAIFVLCAPQKGLNGPDPEFQSETVPVVIQIPKFPNDHHYNNKIE